MEILINGVRVIRNNKASSFARSFYYKENHTLCVWSKKTFRDSEKKTSNDIIKVAGNRKNYNQRRTLNER